MSEGSGPGSLGRRIGGSDEGTTRTLRVWTTASYAAASQIMASSMTRDWKSAEMCQSVFRLADQSGNQGYIIIISDCVVLDNPFASSARHSGSDNDGDRTFPNEDIPCSWVSSHDPRLDKRFTPAKVEVKWMSLVRRSRKLSQSKCSKLNVISAARSEDEEAAEITARIIALKHPARVPYSGCSLLYPTSLQLRSKIAGKRSRHSGFLSTRHTIPTLCPESRSPFIQDPRNGQHEY